MVAGTAPANAPMNGMKLNNPAINASVNASFTPSSVKPMPVRMPMTTMSMSWPRNHRDIVEARLSSTS